MVKLLPISGKDLPENVCERRVSIAKLLLFGFAIPPIGLAYFIVRTMITDFEGSTYTNCEVLNILPSVSAIARAQLLGWKLVTWLVLPFRLLIIYLYRRYYSHVFTRSLGCLVLLFFIYESLSTVVMALWVHISGDSMFHKVSVLSIWFSSFGYIGISFLCFKKQQCYAIEPHQRLSYMLKRKLVISYYSGTLIMWCWYPLHTYFCLPLAYSIFAFCEYIVSWSLMGYLWTSAFDFYPIYLCHDAQHGYFLTDI
ncbi:post-GPI attachment to proteins factor 2 [Drosophila innubila]|uniref:post-GPI attachment to proteins factor 2 n=1 Tax=Drosophila innubila TaxID=198719 RepID=UPI00148BE229|nr:post-GPI attachment to proteins factor 2 [Drosophila innubila]